MVQECCNGKGRVHQCQVRGKAQYASKPNQIQYGFILAQKRRYGLETHWAFPLIQHLDSYWLITRRFGLEIYRAVPLT